MITRSVIQERAKKAWLKCNKIGTFELTTGTGKTIASLGCLYTMPKDDKLHLFLAETNEREKDLLSDIETYNKMYNVDVLKDYNLKFYCYQTVWKWKDTPNLGLIICDEIHNSLSDKYIQFYENNEYDAIVALSATIDDKIPFDFRGTSVTKYQLLQLVAPTCFKYTIADAKKDGLGRKLDIYLIKHQLDEVNRTVKAGNAKSSFLQTEAAAYRYWEKRLNESYFILDAASQESMIKIFSAKRAKILYDLPSKVAPVKDLVYSLPGKTILFGNSLDFLKKITNNVISSKNKDEVNETIRRMFDTNRITVIGSFKKLRQGANLKELDNCVVASYYSSETHIAQQIGRLRKNGDKYGSVFIFTTSQTQEEIWVSKMLATIQEEFEIIGCENVQDCLIKYTNRNNDRKI